MPWVNDKYFYTVKFLRELALNYDDLYNDWSAENGHNLFSVAEYKADFDISLSKLPRELKLIMKAYLEGTPDRVMEARGYNVAVLRKKAYQLMTRVLNGVNV